MNNISFPGLGLEFVVKPDAFTVFGRDIKWYALIILTGMILAVLFSIWESNRVGISNDTILDIAIICIPIAIICARAYYVVCEWSYYSRHTDEIIQIWNGGLAIYGGIIGGCLSAFIYCRIKKINIGEMFDIGALGFLIGQSIGRWGNFTNAEAFGYETDLPWRMYIEEINMAVHPTFLYESLWNTLGFIILFFYRKHKKFSGEVFLLYAIWYGIGRAYIEGLRADSLYIANTGIRTSQLLAILIVVASVIIISVKRYKLHKRKKFRCKCCGYYTLSEKPLDLEKYPGTFEICPVCDWEDDSQQFLNPDKNFGPNGVSLNEAKANFKKFGAISEEAIGRVRKPKKEEIE